MQDICLQFKLEQSNRESLMLQGEINTLKNEKTQMLAYVRELEQKNDDLERKERLVTETAASIEASLHRVMEKNALLESEVDEKENLKEQLQRLSDEKKGSSACFAQNEYWFLVFFFCNHCRFNSGAACKGKAPRQRPAFERIYIAHNGFESLENGPWSANDASKT